MRNSGFTLIETIVYLALFTLMIGGLVASSYMLFETSDRNQTKAMMQEEANFLVGKINWIMSGMRTASITSGTLIATKYDGTIFKVCQSGSVMKFASSTPTCVARGVVLNNSNTTIRNLVFIHTYAGGTNPESVEAGFTITATTSTGSTISQTVSTTRYIRK